MSGQKWKSRYSEMRGMLGNYLYDWSWCWARWQATFTCGESRPPDSIRWSIRMRASRDHSRYRFRVSCCFVFRFVNSCLGEHGGFLVLLGWLSPLVETWWRRDDGSGYSGKTRSVPFYIWIWTTYTLWLPGSLIGYNAGFIQDPLVYLLKPIGNLCWEIYPMRIWRVQQEFCYWSLLEVY